MLENIIISSLVIVGLYYSTYYELDEKGNPCEKNILWFFRFYVDKYVNVYLAKPIISCPRCMASIYGTICYLLLFDNYILSNYILFIFGVSTLNTIFHKYIDL
jgi:hypothetical protein